MARKRRFRRYYKKKRGSRKGSKAIPLAQASVVAYPVWLAYHEAGLTAGLPSAIVTRLTGFNPVTHDFNAQTAIANGGSLLLLTLVGSKIANRTGANRLAKKLTGGYFKIA